MRNVEKIKSLEHELGRCRKKIADQDAQLEKLRGRLSDAWAGSAQTQMAVDALITAVALAYGEDAADPDRPGQTLGKRLALPLFDVQEMHRRYELHARRDKERGLYVVGILPRE